MDARQAERSQDPPSAGLRDIHPALPLRARRSCYWFLRDTGTPSLGSTVGGNSQTHMVCASVPFSPWHHSQTRGEGEVKSAGEPWVEEGLRGKKAGMGRGLKVRA